MVHHFDHRFATYERDGTIRDTTLEEHQDPTFAPMPRYWVTADEVLRRLEGWHEDHDWLLCWRKIARSTDDRTFIASVLPVAAAGDSLILGFPRNVPENDLPVALAFLASMAFDYVARQKLGGTNMAHFITAQLPVPNTRALSHVAVERLRAVSAATIAGDAQMAGLLGCGEGPAWDESLRWSNRVWMEAAIFRAYGLGRDDVVHVLNSFDVTRRRDVTTHGSFRTRDAVLEAFDMLDTA